MNIRQSRKLAGLTQVQLAIMAGIDRVRLSFAECSYIELTPEEKASVAKAIVKAAGKKAERAASEASCAVKGANELQIAAS